MRLLVIGATGKTGRAIVEQAKARGHSVTTFGRSDANDVVGSPMDVDALAAAMRGHDAVLSAIGAGGLGRTSVRADSARAVIAAMQRTAVRRFIVMSSTLVDAHQALLMRFLAATLAHGHASDQRSMEKIVTASDVDWTIVRPPVLTNGPLTGRVELATSESGEGSVSRNDVAKLMLDLAEGGGYKRQVAWMLEA
jgi:putative NADH-flavin reductase